MLSNANDVFARLSQNNFTQKHILIIFGFLFRRNPDLISDLKTKRPPSGRVGLTSQAEDETELDFVYRKVWEYMVSLTAKDCSVMVSMQRVQSVIPSLAMTRDSGMASSGEESESLESSSADEDSDLESAGHGSGMSYENIIFDERTGLAFAVSVAITDLDPKVPANYCELERKWREKDYLMVAAFNASQTLAKSAH